MVKILNSWLGFDPSKMKLKNEVIGGITSFLAMAYIIIINPMILAETGMDKGALFTATILSSAIATLFMAFIAKLPLAQAPSMGINAFFAYTIVLSMGYSWQTALLIIFIEGLLFLILTLSGLREKLIRSIPISICKAIPVGIGLFLAFIALRNSNIIVDHEATLVTMGQFTPQMIIGLVSILMVGGLLYFNIRGSLLISIILSAAIAYLIGAETFSIDGSIFSLPPSVEPTFMKFDFSELLSLEIWMLIFVFCFMDLFNTLGTIYGATSQAGMLNEKQEIPRVKQLFMSDALGTMFGAVLGTSTVTVYVESVAGISEGARSGIAALVTALLFIFSLFFSALFLMVPAYATTGAMFAVALMMCSGIKDIDFKNYSEAVPAFITLVAMPLTYSIAEGISLGMISYVIIKLMTGQHKQIHPASYIVTALFIMHYLV